MRTFSSYISVLLVCIGLASCQNSDRSRFEIVNNCSQTIDSLSIRPHVSKQENYVSVNSGETKVYLVDMSNIPKIDGSYNLTFKTGEIRRTKNFGYYTNGYPTEKLTIINIESDTIRINSILRKY